MSVKKGLLAILDELEGFAYQVDDEQFGDLVSRMVQARHIYLAGAGRSGVAIRAFANRLMQLGMSVSVVGDITSPHTEPNDLLIIGSGSGETASLVTLADKTIGKGVKLALITMDAQSRIAKEADTVVVLPGVSPKVGHEQTGVKSIQPMGAAFEQLMFLTCDALVLELMPLLHETSDSMFKRHADLE
ncbi:SIS domain-containing protein [Lacticaseibacillus pabuli]|uniref:SIS domain-containing protein n=1 Tax=Lacticaseibacillus pabuli TaxID=3025672 RepID=A0ABY7WXE2_9LACO|nr:6-phospho-3-hexuloisomerase [Lacticaseibacillus sp. KACC 23028]WDF82600.1 SIS domain-containing protein [Lacticaseibacillus sp. KACC 23028]